MTQQQTTDPQQRQWYVLRDLKRPNAKYPAYMQLSDEGYEVFTPMKWVLRGRAGNKERMHVPAMSDLLFVHSVRKDLDSTVAQIPTLQYRYVRGGYCKAMTVGEKEMENFILATQAADRPVYYSPSEIDSMSIGKTVMIMDGPMKGVEGRILKVRGARKKRVVVELPGFIAAVMEVESEFLKFTED